jgi:hypothetical protein
MLPEVETVIVVTEEITVVAVAVELGLVVSTVTN